MVNMAYREQLLSALEELSDEQVAALIHIAQNMQPTVSPSTEGLTREQVREKLRAAGILRETISVPPDAKPLSDDERETLGL